MRTETALFHQPGRDGRGDVYGTRGSVRWWVPVPGPQASIVSKGAAAQGPGIPCICGWHGQPWVCWGSCYPDDRVGSFRLRIQAGMGEGHLQLPEAVCLGEDVLGHFAKSPRGQSHGQLCLMTDSGCDGERAPWSLQTHPIHAIHAWPHGPLVTVDLTWWAPNSSWLGLTGSAVFQAGAV